MQKSRVQKLITFSPQLYSLVEDKATRLGVSFPEYIRSLAVEDIKEEKAPFLVASAELSDAIDVADKEYKNGEYKEIDPENEDDMRELFGDK